MRIKNFLALAFNRGGMLLLQLILVPSAIYLLGKTYYGEWLMLSSLPNYLMISDLGINITVTTSICALVAQGDYEKAISLYKNANGFILIIAVLVLVLFLLSFNFLHWNEILNLKLIYESEVEVCLFLLISSTFTSFILGLLLGIYRAEEKFYLSEILTGFNFILDYLIFLILIYFKFNFTIISLAPLILRLTFILIVSLQLSSKYSWFHFQFSFNLKPVFNILPNSIYYMAYIIGYALTLQGTIFFIGKYMGGEVLVTYNTTRTLANSLKSFISAFYFSYLPEYTVLFAKHKKKEANVLFKKMFTQTFIVTTLLAVLYYIMGDHIMSFWTNNKIKIENPFYPLLLLSVFFSTLGNCSYIILNASNENKNVGIYYTILALLSMLSLYQGLKAHFGLTYVGSIMLFIELSFFIVQYLSAKRKLSR